MVIVIIAVNLVFALCSCSNDNFIESAIKTVEDSNTTSIVVSIDDKDYTKLQLDNYSCGSEVILGENVDESEITEQTLKILVLSSEAEQRGKLLSEEDSTQIDNYTNEDIPEYYKDIPLNEYKAWCKMLKLYSNLKSDIQDEILKNAITIDDANTIKLCNDFTEYAQKLSKKSETMSENEKQNELEEWFDMYNEVEESYYNYLFKKHIQ